MKIYNKIKLQIQKPTRRNKRVFYEDKLKQKITQPKELWKSLRSMILP